MKVQLVKLGGGLIAPKNWPAQTADIKTIKRLGKEIKAYRGQLIIGHGGGNFPHSQVGRGPLWTQQAASDLHNIVMREFLDLGLPVASVAPHDIWVASSGKVISSFYEPIKLLVRQKLIPVVYGDVIWDKTRGSTIFSTETCLGLLVREFRADRIIQVSSEEGVWDENGRVIKEINASNFSQLKSAIGGSRGVDVTGGMLHKVEESLKLAKDLGIETVIISGKVRNRLSQALQGIKVLGTRIGR